MRFVTRASSYVRVAILSSSITAVVAYSMWSTMTTPSGLPEQLHEKPAKPTKQMTPERALAVAIKSLVDRKVWFFDRYKIEMTPKENQLSWGVWFIALPESPGMDVYVTVANDGKTSILPGR